MTLINDEQGPTPPRILISSSATTTPFPFIPDCSYIMSFTQSFGRNALAAFRGLVSSSKAVVNGKPTATESSDQHPHVLNLGVGKCPQPVEPRFVVLVFIQYAGWYRGSQGSSRSMQLNSVRNDLIKVLKYLRYRHNDKTTMWHLLTDFDLVYTDEAGYVKLLPTTNPTRNAILNALTEAGKTGGSGLVYFGAHGEYGPPGTSVLQNSGQRTYYTVNVEESVESLSSFLLAIDGGRISGEDIFACLPEDVAAECVHTVALDTCNSGGLAGAARNIRYLYNGEPRTSRASSPEAPAGAASAGQRSPKQLVIISAAREGELARTVHPGMAAREHGSLTWYLIDWLKKHPYATAQNVAERLHYRCFVKAPEGKKQHPEISARYSLTDSFELLPGLLPQSLDESSSAKRVLPPPLTIRWFRSPRLARGRMR